MTRQIALHGVPSPARVPYDAAGEMRMVTPQAMQAARHLDEWAALAQAASEPNPFYESWYLLPSLRNLPEGRAVHLLRFELGGRLAGLLPIARPWRYYRWPLPHLAGWLHPNMFCGAPLVARGAEAAFWRALLGWADQHAGMGLFFHMGRLPLQGPLYRALARVLAEDRREAGIVERLERAVLSSDLSPTEYAQTAIPARKRKELRRQARRLGELGTLTTERRLDAADICAWCDAFLRLEAAGWKGRQGSALGSHDGNAALLHEALAGAARRGRLERLTLSLDGAPVAMLATFLTPPGAFAFKTAYDERLARFSPGVLLQMENLAVLDRDDIAWSDSCAAADHPMIDHIWRERRAVGSVSIAIGGKLRRAAFGRLLRAEMRGEPERPLA